MFISLINQELLYTFKLLLLKVFANGQDYNIAELYKSPFHVELTFDFSTKKRDILEHVK